MNIKRIDFALFCFSLSCSLIASHARKQKESKVPHTLPELSQRPQRIENFQRRHRPRPRVVKLSPFQEAINDRNLSRSIRLLKGGNKPTQEDHDFAMNKCNGFYHTAAFDLWRAYRYIIERNDPRLWSKLQSTVESSPPGISILLRVFPKLFRDESSKNLKSFLTHIHIPKLRIACNKVYKSALANKIIFELFQTDPSLHKMSPLQIQTALASVFCGTPEDEEADEEVDETAPE